MLFNGNYLRKSLVPQVLVFISPCWYIRWSPQATSHGSKPLAWECFVLAFYVTFNILGKSRSMLSKKIFFKGRKLFMSSEIVLLFCCPAGLCTLATVCCHLAGMDLLHRVSMLPDKVDGSLGWSLYLALISSPLHMMAAALLVWAARSHSQSYYRMSAYRVA